VFRGWMSFGGSEVINNARTQAYTSHMLAGLTVTDCDGCDNLHEALGDKPYTSPLVDQPEWFDASNPDTWNFMGPLLLEAEGVEDGTTQADVTELTSDGGYISRPRKASREMRFRAVLIGLDDAAVQAGMVWLRKMLDGDWCRSDTQGCTGDHLCYFAACPQVCEDSPNVDPDTGDVLVGIPTRLCPSGDMVDGIEQCVRPYERHLYRVSTTSGPTVLQEYDVDCGAMWEVEWTMVAGVPTPFASPIFVGKTQCKDEPSELIEDADCPDRSATPPLQDPNCKTPAPPRPPLVLSDCLEYPTDWRRFQLDVPTEYVPAASVAVPLITLRTFETSVNQVRIRFFPNPFGFDVTHLEGGCNFCGEFLVSYMPKNSEMTINGMTSSATVVTFDGSTAVEYQRRTFSANHLLYGSDGSPMSWPELSCGVGYAMTVDVVPDLVDRLEIRACLSVKE
jgi:hypothetical protein